MERKQKIALVLTMSIIAVFTMTPLAEKFTCLEPEKNFASMILERTGLVTPRPLCPTAFGTFLSVVKNMCLALMGALIGYMQRGIVNGESDQVKEEADEYTLYLRSVMEEVRFPEDFMHESMIKKRDIF